MDWKNDPEVDAIDLAQAYDRYIITAFDAQLPDTGWCPVCLDEFAETEYRSVWLATPPEERKEAFDYMYDGEPDEPSQKASDKGGVTIVFDSYGETQQVELVRESYMNGKMAVLAYLSDPTDEEFGGLWGSVTVNLDSAAQHDETVLLDTNNMSKSLLGKVMRLGTATGESVRSGYCSYPAFAFDAEVVHNMRDTDEFRAAEHVSLADLSATCRAALENVYGEEQDTSPDLESESRDMESAKDALAGENPAAEIDNSRTTL